MLPSIPASSAMGSSKHPGRAWFQSETNEHLAVRLLLGDFRGTACARGMQPGPTVLLSRIIMMMMMY